MDDLLILQASSPNTTPRNDNSENGDTLATIKEIQPSTTFRKNQRSKSVSFDIQIPLVTERKYVDVEHLSPPPTTNNMATSPQSSPRSPTRRASIASYTTQIRDFVAPATGDELLKLIYSNEVTEFADDWTLITRPNNSTIWLNKQTGKFRTYPPNTIYKKLMADLQQRNEEIKSLRNELKDIKQLTGKCVTQLNTKQEVEQDLSVLQQKYSEVQAVLTRTNYNLLKTKDEIVLKESLLRQKDMELEKQKKNMSDLDDKVHKAETVLDTMEDLKNQLAAAQTALREKEFALQQASHTATNSNQAAQKANEVIAELSKKNDNLKYQIRLEIERNANIEAGLINLEETQRENEKLKQEMDAMQSELSNNKHLLNSCRRYTRQQGDEIVHIKCEKDELSKQKQNTENLNQEIQTLKSMLVGKDALIARHTQTINALSQLIKRLKALDPIIKEEIELYLNEMKMNEIMTEKIATSKKRPKSAAAVNGITSSSTQCGDHIIAFSSHTTPRLLTDRPQSVSPSLRTTNHSPGSGYGHAQVTKIQENGLRSSSSSSYYSNTAGYPPRPNTYVKRSKSLRNNQIKAVYGTSSTDVTDNANYIIQLIPKRDRDAIAALYLHLGDRVQLNISGNLKSGVVKYVGKLGQNIGDHKVYAGVKMEAKVGNTDGSYDGVRYFTTSPNLAMFVRTSKVVTVYNVKKDSFRRMDDCLNEYAHITYANK